MIDIDLTNSTSSNRLEVDTLKAWLTKELAQALEISKTAIATNQPFSRLGLDSVNAVRVIGRLGQFLGRKIPVTSIWSYPTIDKLCNHLGGNSELDREKSPQGSFLRPGCEQPIAVIGISCRFPGAPDPASFWQMLASGRSAIREITPDRRGLKTGDDADRNKFGPTNTPAAGLLESIDKFDPGFFGISPREAIQMDPQQRLALELAWEALECAGIRPGTLRGSRTGLFVGVAWHDYQTLARRIGAEITLHSGTGQAFSIVANRVSYALGLQGPSIALDTACSSSLVSVHLACQSLYFGDANLAIAGGVNLIIDPETTVALSAFGGLSPSNLLCAFDARANGFVRGEGGGFVVLKPLNRAIADGDPVYAVIRGTAVNNDGASNGLTAPNPLAQETVVREAYLRAGIRTADVDYVEAHGTGTQLGDPIEAQALGSVFASERPGARPLLLGSVKTNIGHLESAAGIAGLIKLILSLKHRQVPPSLNFQTPNPHIDFTGSNLRVVTELEPWPDSSTPAIGGVSSFGWGGTNCHIVVEEAVRSHAYLLPLSAPDVRSLKATAETLKAYLRANARFLSLGDVCATAAARLSTRPHRVALTATSLSDLDHQLEGFLCDQKRPGVAAGCGATSGRKLAFTFSPQGSQWLGMGRSLLTAEPVFRAKLAECDQSLTALAGWSLFDLLLGASEESRFSQVEFIQPALSAIQLALAELWISWGVRPDFVGAHSLGEWAAAGVAGALTIDEVMRVAVESSRSQSVVGSGGGMAIVELTCEEVAERIQEWSGEIFIAGQNSPTSILLSGNASRLKSLVTIWKDEGLTCSIIDVNTAAHSPCMDSAADRLQGLLGGLHPTRSVIPLVSSVTGGRMAGQELGPKYWARHLRQPVLFRRAIEQLADDGCTVFLEISPHPVLIGSIKQVLAARGIDGVALGSCRRADDERQSLLCSLGALYVLGQPIEWRAVLHGGREDLDFPIPNASPGIVTRNTAKEVNDTAQCRPSVPTTSYSSMSLLPLSGHTNSALRDRAQSIAQYLRTQPETSLDDVLHTLGVGREHLEHRFGVVGAGREQLISKLEAFAGGKSAPDLDFVIGRARSGAVPRVAFVCSGQGPQWQGMGRELMRSVPVFRTEILWCAEAMKPHASWDLLEELERDESNSRMRETEIAQPALFAVQVALAATWRSWGIVPHALIGHSAGEIAAAYLSGALSLEDAVMVICRRAHIMQRAAGFGKMAALEMTESDAEELLRLHPDRISIAAVNSPTSVVFSGDASAIDSIVEAAADQGVRAKFLPVDYAFHSIQIEPFRMEMVESVSELKPHTPSIPIYSTVTGAQAASNDFGMEYWGRNIRQTVRFAAATRAMLDAGIDTFVELSPHPVLSAMIGQCAEAIPKRAQPLPSLRHGVSEQLQMFRSLAALFVAGAEVDWKEVCVNAGRMVLLPPYPWQRKRRFWFEVRADALNGSPAKMLTDRPNTHPLLGGRLCSPVLKDTVFQSELSARVPAFLEDHQICGQVVLPAAAYVEIAIAGAHQVFGEGMHCVEDLSLDQALQLDVARQTTVQMILQSPEEGSAAFEVFSAPDQGQAPDTVWTQHVKGRVARVTDGQVPEAGSAVLGALRNRCTESVDIAVMYRLLSEQGSRFGPAFQNIRALWRSAGETVAEIVLADSLLSRSADYRLHPALLDACFQAAIHALPEGARSAAQDEVLLPVNIERVQMFRDAPATVWCHSRVDTRSDSEGHLFTLHLQLYDVDGAVLGAVTGLQLKRVKRRMLDRSLSVPEKEWLFEMVWRETLRVQTLVKGHSAQFSHPGSWLILADERGTGESVRDRLASVGQRCVLAYAGADFTRLTDNQLTLDPGSRLDFQRLLQEIVATGEEPLKGVLHLWSLDLPDFDSMTKEELTRSQLLASGAALHLVQAITSSNAKSPPRFWLITRGAQAVPETSPAIHPAMAPLWGLGQVIASEHPELRCRRIDLDPQRSGDYGDVLFAELTRDESNEDAIVFRNQSCLVPRLVPILAKTTTGSSSHPISQAVQLAAKPTGILENLHWAPLERVAPGAGEVEIQVQATGLNFRDVLYTLGMYPGEIDALGGECAGIITRIGDGINGLELGDQIMAVAPGGFSTYLTLRRDYVARVPDGMSIAEGASIPVAFLTAFYALHRLARMKAGDRVLIHAAAGGVGLAAVQLARRAGAEIFVTAGNEEKRSYLRGLGVEHVFDSRSTDFAAEILGQTEGHGVDIVLNSLAGEFIGKSVSVLAAGGRFLELGKRGILSRQQFAALRPDCEYRPFDLGEEALADASLLPGMFAELSAALASGGLRTLPLTLFKSDRVVEAFRFMAQAKHIGKIVVTKCDPETEARTLLRTVRFRDDATYLITGGLGGLGLETARWMTCEGARNLVLVGRHAPDTATSTFLQELRHEGVRIAVEKCDVSEEAEVAAMLQRTSESLPPLRGIIHAAGVLDDGIIEQQTWLRFENVLAAKVHGAWNLHRQTLSVDLDFFVFFSAAATLIGSPGQASYAAANAFMDALAHHRKSRGLSAVSINWGAWAETGMAARLAAKDAQRWADRGFRPIGLSEGMAKLGEMLASSRAQTAALPVDWSKLFAGFSGSAPSLFEELINGSVNEVPVRGEARPAENDLSDRLAAEPGRRLAILEAHVQSAALRVLGATGYRLLDPRRPLHEVGLDSLMSIELRNSLANSLRRALPATLLFDYPTLESLVRYLAKDILMLELTESVSPEGRVEPSIQEMEELEKMSESEAELLLLAELDQAKN